MPCETVKVGGNRIAVVCSRGRRKWCAFCHKRPAVKLCDFPVVVGDIGHTRTCDAEICAECATSVGPDRDHCPKHASK